MDRNLRDLDLRGRHSSRNKSAAKQDTTELDDTKRPTADAGCLNSAQRFGLYEHVHLAVTPDKLCLGVVGSEFFDRAPESLGQARERRTLPIDE